MQSREHFKKRSSHPPRLGRSEKLMRLSQILILVATVTIGAHSARCTPTQADILEYTATTLLTSVDAAIHNAEKSGGDKSFYAQQYYGILYVLWFSTKTDTPISPEVLESYFRAFNESAKKFQADKLIDRDDPLRIGALSPETVSDARKMMMAGVYWDWVIAKNENKRDYRRYVEEFNRQLNSAK
jgi:hypothetical protein